MVKVFSSVFFWGGGVLSLLSEFDFDGYMPLIRNMKKELIRLLFSQSSSLLIILQLCSAKCCQDNKLDPMLPG